MNARAFLVRGLVAGLIAGFAAFLVGHVVGEPQIDTAISLEEAASAAESAHTHDAEEEGGTEVSRTAQATWGLLTGNVTVGLAVGGIVALISAATIGRLGRLQPGQSTALVTALGFVSFALVPFLKYPSTPPAVGDGETIGWRTALYFGFLAISIVAVIGATYLALRLRESRGTYVGVTAGIVAYVLVMVIVGTIFPTVNEIGDFPADTLWYFRIASLYVLATFWGVLGIVLTGLVRQLYAQAGSFGQQRELAAAN